MSGKEERSSHFNGTGSSAAGAAWNIFESCVDELVKGRNDGIEGFGGASDLLASVARRLGQLDDAGVDTFPERRPQGEL